MIGFFEESQGVRSMTRLAIFWTLVLASLVVAVIAVYALRGSPNATVISALVGALGALVLKGCVAIINRNGGDNVQ